MRRASRIISTVVVIAVLISAVWIFAYNTVFAPPVASGGGAPPVDQKAAFEPKAVPPGVIEDGVTVGSSGLVVPVAGIRRDQLVDTFTQARAGGGRLHDAIDIMAGAGTPVVAASAGLVEKLFVSPGGGGITAYVRSTDDRWIAYYAHMQGYAPGLTEGQKVLRGQIIGYVGSTGNASPAGPHLHFAIHRMGPGEKWWQGSAINPYPLLAR